MPDAFHANAMSNVRRLSGAVDLMCSNHNLEDEGFVERFYP